VAASRVTTITQSERERRVAEAIHSGEMEGLDVTPAGREDAAEYVAGRIDSDELVARARARYGLGNAPHCAEETCDSQR
jgi:Antitoxin VbhA